MDTAHQQIADWLDVIEAQQLFSASAVQDRLFDLYSAVKHLGVRPLVEDWLTLTVHRELFSAAELRELLFELRLGLPSEVGAH
jgi:hypothetical protein